MVQSVGFAGALDSTLKAGTVLTPICVIDARDGTDWSYGGSTHGLLSSIIKIIRRNPGLTVRSRRGFPIRVRNQIKNETHPILAGWVSGKTFRATHTPASAYNNTGPPAWSAFA